ncbi:MAG: hypothetical protein AB7H88_04560 [Vicinamibacterales bacterium]
MKYLALIILAVVVLASTAACSGGTPTSPSTIATTPTTGPSPSGGTGAGGSSTSTVAYTTDVKPVLDTDCTPCHNSRTRQAGVDLSSYASVLRTLSPGNPNSLLVLVTRSNGPMYGAFSGNRAAKAELIRSWVVDNNAAQSR